MSACTFTNATVLTADGVVGSSIRIQGEFIVAINEPYQKNDVVVNCQGGVIIPGLINAHDHLGLNNFDRIKYQESYSNASDWVNDIQRNFDTDIALIEPRQKPLADRLLQGAMKNLLSGVTTVCHHDPDYSSIDQHFPVRIVRPYEYCHSLYINDNFEQSYLETDSNTPWIIHLAEGIDEEARSEFDRLESLCDIKPNCVIVHGVGLSIDQQRKVADNGGGLIWCPGSNHFLFKKTVDIRYLNSVGKVALGSDSRLSGERDLLAEMRFAEQTKLVTSRDIIKQVTVNPAKMLKLRHAGAGTLEVGGTADLLFLPATSNKDLYDHVININRSQIECVLLAGKPVITSKIHEPLFKTVNEACTQVQLDGCVKLLSEKIVKRLQNSTVSEPGLKL